MRGLSVKLRKGWGCEMTEVSLPPAVEEFPEKLTVRCAQSGKATEIQIFKRTMWREQELEGDEVYAIYDYSHSRVEIVNLDG